MILLASDHAGFELKEKVKKYLDEIGKKYEDLGNTAFEANDDYPDFVHPLAKRVSENPGLKGILFCGSGQGMAIVANRYPNVRAAVCWDIESARETRKSNDSNVLSIPARMVDEPTALKIIKIWLETPFSNEERHTRRIKKIDSTSSL